MLAGASLTFFVSRRAVGFGGEAMLFPSPFLDLPALDPSSVRFVAPALPPWMLATHSVGRPSSCGEKRSRYAILKYLYDSC
jgi:hypothetical protein